MERRIGEERMEGKDGSKTTAYRTIESEVFSLIALLLALRSSALLT